MAEWKEIASAPKDGTPILVACVGKTPVTCMWSQSGYGQWVSLPGRYAGRPTHWMPLPTPPETPKERP